MTRPSVVILGAGRMGQGLALALGAAGHGVTLLSRSSHPIVSPLRLHVGPRGDALRAGAVVLLAVPDGAITSLAAELQSEGGIGSRHVVLHLSGLRDRAALDPLAASGAALGSLHPLQTVSDPATAATQLKGAYAGIEGDEGALAAAELLATSLGMIPVKIPAEAKPSYHAGAAFAANYTTVLVGVAERLALAAGIHPEVARRLYLPLIRGAAANLEAGPAGALTGPVRRGDVETVAAHLAALGSEDRQLYLLLAREALRLAGEAGLPPEAAARMARVLDRSAAAG
ncbi:MAG: DUF2520 domain-containing protein [Gemmatimonadales bacterium]|nr:DUF2520 domain-containing protein [Gemmatimonadales bacterium]